MKILFKYIIFLAFISLLCSCGDGYNNHYANVLREKRESLQEKTKQDKIDDALLKTNKIANEKEIQQIKGYIQRRGWDMTILPTGVFVQEIEKGKNQKINDSSIVKIHYTIELLDGKKVFSSDIDGEKIIKINSEQTVVGLVYVLKQLQEGSKARAIIPSYLAYGLPGDGDKIPKRSSLVYYIHVKDVK